MSPIEVIQRLALAKSRADKEQVLLAAFTAGCPDFFIGLRLSADPFYTFGLTKVALIYEDSEDHSDTFSFAAFEALAARLYARLDDEATARQLIHQAAESCDATLWNQFYRRILLKKLDEGLDLRICTRLYKRLGDNPEVANYRIPQRYWQRSQTVSRPAVLPVGDYLIDGCLVGDRLLAVLDKASTVSLHTNKGQVVVPEVQAALMPLLARLPGSLVFDGVHHAGRYTMFDVMPLTAYKTGHTDRSQRARHVALVALQEAGYFEPPLAVLPKLEMSRTIADFATIRQQMANDGYAAMFVKDATAGYDGAIKSAVWRKYPTT